MKRALAGFFCASLLVIGCAKASREDPQPAPSCSCPPGDAVVDVELMAFLSKARAAHHKADLAAESDDTRGAIAVLEQLVDGALPRGNAPEVAEVMSDTRARLADLRSSLGDFDKADRDVEAGLLLAREPTYFRGHLVEMQALVFERRAKALREAGDGKGAEAFRQKAAAAFEETLRIQDDVIKRSLPKKEK